MSMGPLGGDVGSAAGAPLSQTGGSESERAQKDALAHGRQLDAEQMAERAAGIGETEQDEQSSERDADGRRPWEAPPKPGGGGIDGEPDDATRRQSKDATGQCGSRLDLTG